MGQKVLLLLCALLYACLALRDETIRPGASGPDVVRAVIGRIEGSNIFLLDKQFLRRIAYVESKDGTDDSTYRSGYHGGIWQVDEVGFRDTQDNSSHPGLTTKFDKIQKYFGIDWRDVQWEDLRKPLYSGLAARLFLYNIPDAIPAAGNIQAQGEYWKEHYDTPAGDGTVEEFVEDVKALLEKETCKINSDIFFVLDTSGSVGASNFQEVKGFVSDFVTGLKIGPNDTQVGVILFGSTGTVEFYLNSHSTNASLLTAIQNIVYRGGSTNTPDGLCKLITEGYTIQHGARLSSASVLRLAVVMTDGRSNQGSLDCPFEDVLQAANAVHSFEPSILVYAIGVTDNIKFQELSAIATGTQYIFNITSFNATLFRALVQQQTYDLCNRASVSQPIGDGLEGCLDNEKTIRYRYELPESGMYITLCVRVGNIVLYVSTVITSPNSAFYEYKLNVSGDSCEEIYVPPPRRDLSTVLKNISYVSLIGENKDCSEFFINTTKGCSEGDLRLVGGNKNSSGLVQFCHNNEWGYICDGQWANPAASVVCRLVGYLPENAIATQSSLFEPIPPVKFWLDDVTCKGNESSLLDCLHTGPGVQNCTETEAAGVICQEACETPGEVRLIRQRRGRRGRGVRGSVEVCARGAWGAVCDDHWDDNDAKVVCGQLNYSNRFANADHCTNPDDEIPVHFALDDAHCIGNETSLIQCDHSHHYNCIPSEVAGVSCREIPCKDGDIRLVGGSNSNEGDIQLCYNREWRAVCDDRWTSGDARVVCRQLGFSGGITTRESHFGTRGNRYWLDDVRCRGHESFLLNCSHDPLGRHNCMDNEKAGVICSGPKSEPPVNPECTTDGQIFKECGTACPPVCREEQPSVCTKECVPECQCPYGTFLDRDRDRCVLECGPPECNDVDGQRFDECGTACPPVCGEEPPLFCTLQCVPECQCPRGTLLDKDRERCVRECLPPGVEVMIDGNGLWGYAQFIHRGRDCAQILVNISGLPEDYVWRLVNGSDPLAIESIFEYRPRSSCNYEKDCSPFTPDECASGDLSGKFGMLPPGGQIDATICTTEEQRDTMNRNHRGQPIDDLIGYSLVIFTDTEILALEDFAFIGELPPPRPTPTTPEPPTSPEPSPIPSEPPTSPEPSPIPSEPPTTPEPSPIPSEIPEPSSSPLLPVCEIEGQIFLQCGSECPPVCGENKTICSDKCVMGCQCPPGTFLHRGSERCVTECPPVCKPEGGIELTKVENQSISGIVKVCVNGTAGRVVDDDWSKEDARVVCRQLGVSFGIMIPFYVDDNFDEEKTPVVLYNVECEGSESDILKCGRSEVPSFDKRYQIVGVFCIPV